MNTQTYTCKSSGEDIIFEINDWMVHADSSVVASMGDTKVMVAIAVGGETDKDYLPLKVEYQERFYARGEILGGKYNKREGKPTTEAVLTARLIDRAIRPFFPTNFNRDVMVVVTVLALGEYDTDVVAQAATSLALKKSSIPWQGDVVATRVVKDKQGEVFINPTYSQRQDILFDAYIATNDNRLCMIEMEGAQAPETDVITAVELATKENQEIQKTINQITKETETDKIPVNTTDDSELSDLFGKNLEEKIYKGLDLVNNHIQMKLWLKEYIELVKEAGHDHKPAYISRVFDQGVREVVRRSILDKKTRMDGRAMDEVRKLAAQSGVLPKQVHGSGLFYRGDTHVLSVLTLGQLDDALHLEGMEIQTKKNFMHDYNFPPYSVGEVGRMGSPKRREIGHGQLAEKAFRQVLPAQDDFPYTMRVVSEVLSSNGSTSMGSVCGTSLALYDAGVPMKSHVAGIAIGLVYGDDSNYQILTDILGKEDYYGDMDFKVAGTPTGITAIQLDCKFAGLNTKILAETLDAAKSARETILQALENEISKPNELTDAVEKIEKMQVPQDKIGLVIGKGGAMIKSITKDSGAKIDIKRDGTAFIFGSSENIAKAKEMITKVLSRSVKI